MPGEPRLRSITCMPAPPKLLIHGTEDTVVPVT